MIELSQEQQLAAWTDSKSALCLAGAGSGKTRVLVSRCQYLIDSRKVSPTELLLCTFSRKAATEMRERLEAAIGNQAHGVTIGTLHSVALNMIQRFGEMIGLKTGKITIYSTWEESVLLKDVCIELGYHTGKKFKGTTKKDVQAAFNLFYTQKKRKERDYIPNEIMDAFFLRCRENNALTYGMIMTEFLELIPRIGRMLKFKHIIVDEVQDLDFLQWRLIRLLCSVCDASLFVCADQQQCIYEWRSADPSYLIRNKEKFDVFKLHDNYRSDRFIVEAANNLIRHNKNRLELEMFAKWGWSEPVQHFENQDSAAIVENIKLIPEIHQNESAAILARNHVFLDKISRLLQEEGIEHEYIGKKTAFTRSEEFRKVHAFLNLAVNPFDNFSFMIAREYLGIDREAYKSIRMKAVQENRSHFQVFSESVFYDINDPFLVDLIEAVANENFVDVVEWMEMVNFEFESEEVFEFIQQYLKSNHKPTIREYLDWLALYDVQDEIQEDSNKLQLMTIHASKGLEWSMVVIAGLNEGILPGFRAMKDEKEMEAERRLAYVAYTRARDFLILTSRPINPEAKLQQPPSRFIGECFENEKL